MSFKTLLYQRRYGLCYFGELIKSKIRPDGKISFKGIQERQKYFEKLPISSYEEELGNLYYMTHGVPCDFKNPKRFTEKIQWLKLYDTTLKKSKLADKYSVREWVKEKIGAEYLIPLLGVWSTWEDIDFEQLPNEFVLKCNHGAKMNILVRDKESFDIVAAKKIFDQWMKIDFGLYDGTFQLHYSFIKPLIVAEKLMKDDVSLDLRDYKFFCFNGEPQYCQVICDRSKNESVDFYDMEWNHQSITGLHCFKNAQIEPKKPMSFEKMKEITKILSKGFSFVRVDLYEIHNQVYFGEMTFTPGSGFGHFNPPEMDETFGKLIELPKKKHIPDIQRGVIEDGNYS